MKMSGYNCLLVLALVVAMASAGCGTSSNGGGQPPMTYGTTANNQPSDPGGEIISDTVTKTGVVVSVDRARRLVVVKRANGREVTYKALPNALGFDVIAPGDVVKLTIAEELAVHVGKNSEPPGAWKDTAKLRVRLPGGTQAFAAEVATQTYNARIIGLDYVYDWAALQFSDGTVKTIRVSDKINMADFSIGDMLSVRATEAAVVMLEKP